MFGRQKPSVEVIAEVSAADLPWERQGLLVLVKKGRGALRWRDIRAEGVVYRNRIAGILSASREVTGAGDLSSGPRFRAKMAPMPRNFLSGPGHVVLLMLAGWMNRQHQAALAYQKEENRVLREMLGDRRLRFTDAQRRRLALKGLTWSR